jgi:hypothetical protein
MRLAVERRHDTEERVRGVGTATRAIPESRRKNVSPQVLYDMVPTRRVAPDLMRSTGGVRAEISFRAGPWLRRGHRGEYAEHGPAPHERFGDLFRQRIACLL